MQHFVMWHENFKIKVLFFKSLVLYVKADKLGYENLL